MNAKDIAPWELLQKKMTWEQIKYIHNKRVLDFGSGNGMTADHSFIMLFYEKSNEGYEHDF